MTDNQYNDRYEETAYESANEAAEDHHARESTDDEWASGPVQFPAEKCQDCGGTGVDPGSLLQAEVCLECDE
jgi:hypothetical protein